MDRDEALELLKGGSAGIAEWNRRREPGARIPALEDTGFGRINIGIGQFYADLSGASLSSAKLNGANLRNVNLTNANLSHAKLDRADLTCANLRGANLRDADLTNADLNSADLSDADLRSANLSGAKFSGVDLSRADFTGGLCSETTFGDVNLSGAIGLESLGHFGPSTIGIDALFRSEGNIPESFLRDCGVPQSVILNRFALVGAAQPIQFYSCFISYSAEDKEFAKRLHARMVQEELRVWFAPEDIQAGKHIHEQVDRAIQVHDRLLLVLSPHSMNSNWVRHEIRRARKAELKENRRKLFPIRLVDFQAITDWEYLDGDSGEDHAVEIRRYFIPDFSTWKDHDSFEAGFQRLLRDLKAEEATDAKPA